MSAAPVPAGPSPHRRSAGGPGPWSRWREQTLERAGGSAGPGTVAAVVRLFVVAVVFAGSLSDKPFIENHELFPFILGAAAVYALIALWLAHRGRPLPIALSSLLDIAFISALMLASGGAFADVRLAFFLFPVVAAVIAGPRSAARWAALVPAIYLIVAAIHDPGDLPGRAATATTFGIYLAGVGLISIGIAELLTRRESRIESLAEASRTLAVRALESEERERRRLAYALHDEPVQQLLSAQLELDRAAKGDPEAALAARAAVRETIAQLRETVFDLYPSSLEQLGLAAAIEQLAARAADRSGAEVGIAIEAEPGGELEPLLFTIARELVRNSVEHSGADRIAIELSREGDELVLRVSDDGVGIEPGRAVQALSEGHIGLASATERASARGGSLEVESAPGDGTRVVVRLPAPAAPG